MQQPPNPNSQSSQQPWQQASQPLPEQQQWQQSPMPPQQYQQPPQYQPPRKKSRKGLFIILGVILAVALLGCIGVAAILNAGGKATQQASNQTATQVAQLPTTQPTTQQTQPTSQAKWTTVQTITGNGSKKTAIFTAPNDWKILYSCTYQNIGGVSVNGVLTVSVFGSDGSLVDPSAINATCKTGVAKTTGETEEHQGGQVYLDVNGLGDRTIQVQELK